MRACVTGGAGFIGSTLVDRLVSRGDEVLVVDDLSTGRRANLERALEAGAGARADRLRVVELDIRSADGLAAAMTSASPEVVFHLAAKASVRASVEEPARDAEVNVLGTINVLTAARRARAAKVVFTSSGGTIYGELRPDKRWLTEDDPINPLSPYGAAKAAAGWYVSTLAPLYGLRHTTLALANVYGPRQDPLGEAGVVAIFLGRLLAGEPATIFGDGKQTRDFVYVEDVCDAFLAAAEPGRGDGQLLNIGTGVETSVNELYAELARSVGTDRRPTYRDARPGELLRNCLCPARAADVLGWRVTRSLGAGLAELVALSRR